VETSPSGPHLQDYVRQRSEGRQWSFLAGRALLCRNLFRGSYSGSSAYSSSKNGGQVHYIDGVNVGDNPAPVEFDEKSKVVMGQRPGRGLFWDGMIDEVRIYGRPLSEKEVKQNFRAEGLSVESAGKLAETWGNIKF